MAELFGVDRTIKSRHLKIIFITKVLDEQVLCANFSHNTPHDAIEWKTQNQITKIYNLDAIISVGDRVHSIQATHF